MLPLRPGLPERATHDYKRNGTTTLFAALEIATGKVHFDRTSNEVVQEWIDHVARTGIY